MGLSDYCVYTIVHADRLQKAAESGRPVQFSERKAWTTGRALWQQAQSAGVGMPVLLGDATDCNSLMYWGLLRKVQLKGESTRFTVNEVRTLEKKHLPQELILRSTGKNIAPNFIKPYAICVTPDFLMRTFMMTWNPRQSRPADLGFAIRQVSRGKSCNDEWSAGNRKYLPIGSRVFLLRQGVEPRGIVASGYTRSEPEPNNDPGDHSRYCDVVWTMALDAESGYVLALEDIRQNKFLAKVPWGIASGGRAFSLKEATELERLWSELLTNLGKKETSFQ